MLVSGFLQPVPDLLPVIPSEDATFEIDPSVNPFESSIIFFYKTWDLYGSFSNFSPHPIRMPYGDDYRTWSSVEHYYQVPHNSPCNGILLFLYNIISFNTLPQNLEGKQVCWS